jgi:hypothetical protein
MGVQYIFVHRRTIFECGRRHQAGKAQRGGSFLLRKVSKKSHGICFTRWGDFRYVCQRHLARGSELAAVTGLKTSHGGSITAADANSPARCAREPIEMVLFEAPIIERVGPAWTCFRRRRPAVLVRQGNILIATFHPELTTDTTVHGTAHGAKPIGAQRQPRTFQPPRCSG